MDQWRVQLGNYLTWLESRGLTGPVDFRRPPASAQLEPMDRTPDLVPSDKARAPSPGMAWVPNDVRTEAALPSAVAPLPAPGPMRKEAEETLREAGKPWKIGFYSSSDLTEEEYLMVSKIALALGLPAEDFRIWAEDSLVHVPAELLRCSYIVALGPGSGQTLLALGQTVAMNSLQTALQGSPILTIPHPRAMLREPGLKTGAWSALQKLKTLIP